MPIDSTRLLHGPYLAPRCKIGGWLKCRLRGKVKVCAMSDGRIPWPMTRHQHGGSAPYLIVTGSLVRAVKRESAAAVMHWWGVRSNTVWTWRKALGVPQNNEGTLKLHREHGTANYRPEMLEKLLGSPDRAAKIAESKRGKPRPAHVIEAMRRGRMGKPQTAEARSKMSAAQRQIYSAGKVPPAAKGPAWTAEELAMLGTMPDAEVAERIGRSYKAVWQRRRKIEERKAPPKRP